MKKFDTIFSETPNRKDRLVIKRRVQKGESYVYQVYSRNHKKDYALKVFPNTKEGKDRYQREKLVLHFNHPSIVQYIPTAVRGNYTLITEFARYGTFADILEGGPLITEEIARTYFQQLIEGIEYIHSHGFVHLDLKLENITIGEDYMLKIIDFDKSQLVSDTALTSVETQNCYSIETLDSPKKLIATDIFAAGQILFAFRTARLPFLSIDDDAQNPKSYSYFLTNNKQLWRKHTVKFIDHIKFSKEFIDLVNGMLNPNPEERLTIQDIKNSAWYKGLILTKKEIKDMMKRRCEVHEKASMRGSFALLLMSFAQYCC